MPDKFEFHFTVARQWAPMHSQGIGERVILVHGVFIHVNRTDLFGKPNKMSTLLMWIIDAWHKWATIGSTNGLGTIKRQAIT